MDRESTISIIRASAIAAVLISLILLGYRYDKRRVRAAILRCAREHGYDVLATEEYFLSSGPFGWGTSGRARVFRVRVCDASKTERYVWIRVGSYWASPIFDDRTEFMREDT